MMNVLIASDSFKDCLSSREAGEAIRRGFISESDEFKIRVLSVADGGEGTISALLEARGGAIISVKVADPLMREIESSYAILTGGEIAVIEMARASGIELLTPEERNPWITSSFGTGQLMLDALDHGCRRLILAIGGSATNDAGMGMAQALGVRILDRMKDPVGHGGGVLRNIHEIDISAIDKRIGEAEIIVACDVTNHLTGPAGASYIFGPQKGADASMVAELDGNLKYFAGKIAQLLGKEIDAIPGAGAAGGLGGGLLAFANARLIPGFDLVRKELSLDDHIRWADLVITGEGKLDYQTRYGKTPFGIVTIAKQFGKPVIAIAGTLGERYEELYTLGFNAIFSIIDKPMALSEAILSAPQLLEKCACAVARLYLMNSGKV